MEAVRLAPLSECEIAGSEPTFLGALLRGDAPSARDVRVRDHLVRRIVTGCFPEPVLRAGERRAAAWYRQYVNTLIKRDVTDLPGIGHVEAMTKLLRLTAVLSGQLVNLTDLGGRLGLNRLTAGKYLALLEQLFLVERVPGMHRRRGHPPGQDAESARRRHGNDVRRARDQPTEAGGKPRRLGSLLESFVYNELRKQALWMDEPLAFHH